jgi:hypothetical protein
MSTLKRGGLGEPYCSDQCYEKGGKYASAVMLKNQTGVCGFCQKQVQASMYSASNCGVIPYEGINLFVCSNCVGKAKEYLGSYRKCCMCQKEISHVNEFELKAATVQQLESPSVTAVSDITTKVYRPSVSPTVVFIGIIFALIVIVGIVFSFMIASSRQKRSEQTRISVPAPLQLPNGK